jgi:hypothetical protein
MAFSAQCAKLFWAARVQPIPLEPAKRRATGPFFVLGVHCLFKSDLSTPITAVSRRYKPV